MFLKSAEIFWCARRLELQYKCVFCESSFKTHSECLKHLVQPCEQAPHQLAPQTDRRLDDVFYELLTNHGGYHPESYKTVVIKLELNGATEEEIQKEEVRTESISDVDVADSIANDSSSSPDCPSSSLKSSANATGDDDHEEKTFTSNLLAQLRTNSALLHCNGAFIKCDICGVRYGHRHQMLAHMQRRHQHPQTGALSVAIITTATADQAEQLRRDQRHLFAKPKIFCCEICGTQMSELGNLIKHKRIHTGEKPFPCQFCERCFITSTERNAHVRSHTGEKPFKCDQCGRQFRCSSQVLSHKRTQHSDERPYKCGQCSLAFKDRQVYKGHLLTHSDVRPYNCEVCGNSFRQRSAYLVHMNVHNDHRPYKCSQCERGFHSPAARRSHEKTFHHMK